MTSTPQNEVDLALHSVMALWIAFLLSWPIGIEQLVPVVFFGVFAVVLKRRTGVWPAFTLSGTGAILLVFLLCVFLSGLGITETFRIITFLRDIMIWMTAILFLCHWSSVVKTTHLSDFSKVFSWFFWIIAATSLFYIILPSFQFPSLAYLVSPGGIRNTMMGERFLLKSFGEQLYFYGFTNRVSSLFGSPIHLACVAILLLPFAISSRKTNLGKILTYCICFAIVFFAQARLAMVLMLTFPFLAHFFAAIFAFDRLPISVLVVGFCSIVMVMVAGLYMTDIMAFLQEVFFERRKGSAEARTLIYSQSWSLATERLLLGYGTQMDVDGLEYPLGSHSTPLGIMFKHGMFAAMAMCLCLLIPFFNLISLLRVAEVKKEARLLASLLAAYTCYLVLLMVNEFIVDMYHTVILFSVWGIINRCAYLKRREKRLSRSGGSSAMRSEYSLPSTA